MLKRLRKLLTGTTSPSDSPPSSNDSSAHATGAKGKGVVAPTSSPSPSSERTGVAASTVDASKGRGLSSKVTFEITAPQATKVSVAGTFNNWQPNSLPLKKERGGVWKAAVPLTEGTHEYRFVVDGAWVSDDKKEKVPNPFGQSNNRIVVK